MSATFDQVRSLVRVGRFVVSQHGTRRLLSRGIGLDDIVAGLQTAEVIEDYPQYFAGPAVLVLFFDASGGSLHALWGLRKHAYALNSGSILSH